MSTTAIIVEILIIGFLAGVWIVLSVLSVLSFSPLDVSTLKSFFSKASDWSIPLSLAGVAIFYQLGLLMNGVAGALQGRYFHKRWRDPLFEKPLPGYGTVRATVLQNGSPEVHVSLRVDLSFIRLFRAGILNFALIAAILLVRRQLILSVIALVIAALCGFFWKERYHMYYERIRNLYGTLCEQLQR